MARSNYSFQKRQKELERKKKQEEKRERRLAKKAAKQEAAEVHEDRADTDMDADEPTADDAPPHD